MALAAFASFVLAAPAEAVDSGRLDLLAAEAVQAMGGTDPEGSALTLVVLGSVLVLVTMAAALAGTWIGLRKFTFARTSERDGWKEIAYRFRSDRPMRLGPDMVQRMSGVLGEIETLGQKIAKSTPEPTLAEETPTRAAEETPEPVRTPVTFEKRTDPPIPGTSPAGPERVPPVKPPTREDRYPRARRLLSEGHDLATVQRITGLKTAELDLLRSAPELVGAGS